uniref:hypothetical protein n=1 Tax=Roseofilum reptotaenium TaxID=1233427 RepID=UPI0036F2F9B6
MNRHLWDSDRQFFFDYNYKTNKRNSHRIGIFAPFLPDDPTFSGFALGVDGDKKIGAAIAGSILCGRSIIDTEVTRSKEVLARLPMPL